MHKLQCVINGTRTQPTEHAEGEMAGNKGVLGIYQRRSSQRILGMVLNFYTKLFGLFRLDFKSFYTVVLSDTVSLKQREAGKLPHAQ